MLQTQDTLDLQSYHPIHGWVSDNSLFMYHWGYSDEAEQIHLDEVEKVKRHINKKYKEFIKRRFP